MYISLIFFLSNHFPPLISIPIFIFLSFSSPTNYTHLKLKKMQPSGDPAPEKEKEMTQPKVSLLKLFSFADFYDCVLMTLGSVGACIHGASVPIFFIFFGKLINIIGLAYLFPKQASHRVAKVFQYFSLFIFSL